MCSRITQYMTWQELVDRYRLTGTPLNLERRYNIAPQTQIITIRANEKGRVASHMRWGLIPDGLPYEKRGRDLYSAQSDVVASNRIFCEAFKSRRCIIPASGFFEWRTVDGKKQPYHITACDDGPLSFAGLWEPREEGGEEHLSCTIITTDANNVMAQIHNRMPVILDQCDLSSWLNGSAGEEVLKPCANEMIAARAVFPFVNNVKCQSVHCIAPLDSPLPD
jgi:putative SOS response-associated peptidase YedK